MVFVSGRPEQESSSRKRRLIVTASACCAAVVMVLVAANSGDRPFSLERNSQWSYGPRPNLGSIVDGVQVTPEDFDRSVFCAL